MAKVRFKLHFEGSTFIVFKVSWNFYCDHTRFNKKQACVINLVLHKKQVEKSSNSPFGIGH